MYVRLHKHKYCIQGSKHSLGLEVLALTQMAMKDEPAEEDAGNYDERECQQCCKPQAKDCPSTGVEKIYKMGDRMTQIYTVAQICLQFRNSCSL